MSISTRDLDPAFQGAGQTAGVEIWRIENFSPVLVPKSSHGKFFTGDSYIILKTTSLKSGALSQDIHYWLGKDTSQDEAGTAAIKTVELDAALGGRAVQYREVQGRETEKFLSYFKPCIIPQEGGVASGFKHAEAEEHQTRLYQCKGKHVIHVKEVSFARSSLNHDDVFILDTKSKIFQFNGSNSCIQERAKALEVVQYIKDTYHDGKCEIATIEDGRLMSDADTGEFWAVFGGFAPLPRKTNKIESQSADVNASKLFCVEKREPVAVDADSLTRELLDSSQCYILDCGMEVFVWVGKSTSLEERKTVSSVVDEFLRSNDRSNSHIIRVSEGFETVMFRSKFDSWPESSNATASEDGKGKVAALLKRQGVNVKGLVKEETPREDPQLHIDCTGDLQVWRVNGQQKTLLEASDQSKFFSGDCYIFQYSFPGEGREEYLIGTWFGKQSVEEDRAGATSQASKMVETMKFFPTQARIYEGSEPIQFFAIFQSFIILKGGLSEGYKKHIAENELPDDTYAEDGLALFRVQGSGPESMQSIQVEPVPSSLNSAYCYILHSGSSIFTWSGNLTTSEDQELVERQLDIIKGVLSVTVSYMRRVSHLPHYMIHGLMPSARSCFKATRGSNIKNGTQSHPEIPSRYQKEGVESEQFWELLGGKSEYKNQKITREAESDPHLLACTLSNGDLKVTEIYNFNQDDLMTEDIYIVDCHTDIYVWVGQEVELKNKKDALSLGQKFLERDFLHEKLSVQSPIYIVTEGNEPAFFTRFFTWDSKKSAMHGNSFQRKLALLKSGGTEFMDKPRRRVPVIGGRSGAPEKAQRSRSVSVSAERVRVRGRSPAFNALASTFENHNVRNLSTPPTMMGKLFPRSVATESGGQASRSAAIAALSAGLQTPTPAARPFIFPRSLKVSPAEVPRPRPDDPKPDTIHEDVTEGEADDDEGLPTYPYGRLTKSSSDPIEDIDVTKRETYLSVEEFRGKFGMSKSGFYKLPKWKQNKLKVALDLF